VSRTAPEPLKPVYGIWGEDRAKIDRAVQRLVTRVADEGGLPPDRFDAVTTSAADVVAACSAMSLAGTRLVLVRGVDAWRADDVAPLVACLADPVPGTCLALVGDAAPAQRLVTAVGQAGQVLRYGPDPKAKATERTRWFVEHLSGEVRRLGGNMPAPVAREVVARVGEDAALLAQEAAKLAAYAGPEPVSREVVHRLVPVNPEEKAYRLGDAIVVRDAPAAYAMLADLAAGDEPAKPIVVMMTLARHFRNLAAAQAAGPAVTADEVSAMTGLKGFPARKVAEQVRALPPGAAEQGVVRMAALELDLRVSAFAGLGASRDDGERLVLELGVRDLLAIMKG
jgi:DNA polymerase-3 subunit delta